MLSEFTVKNIYSFFNETTLSFKHPSNRSKAFKQNTIYEFNDNGKKNILNGAIILGSNASGKSNLLKSLKHLSNYIRFSFRYEDYTDSRDFWRPFIFNKNVEETTEFSIEIIVTKSIYKNLENDYMINYSFTINNKSKEIEYEKFSYRKVMKSKLSNEKILFHRENDRIIDFTPSYKSFVEKIEKENIDYKLIVSMLFYDINKSFYSEEITRLEYALLESFINFTTIKMNFAEDSSNHEYIQKINEDQEYRKYILDHLNNFDFGIKDFQFEDITEDIISSIPKEDRNSDFLKELINDLKRERKYRVSSIHEVDGNKKSIEIESESHGTKKFLMESVNIYESIINSGIYICDEFESAFHEKIQIGIINSFINSKNTSQFLLVTHNPYLMNKKLFSKEQILFIEKDFTSEISELYSLDDFDITYNNHNWTNLYLDGRFGAVPEVIF